VTPAAWLESAEQSSRQGDQGLALSKSAKALGTVLDMFSGAANEFHLWEAVRKCALLPAERLVEALPFAHHFGSLAERSGVVQTVGPLLPKLLEEIGKGDSGRWPDAVNATATALILGFGRGANEEWATRVFEQVVVPWMLGAAERGDLDTALKLEELAYSGHVMRRESKEWFKATTGRWVAPLAERAARLDAALGAPHARWRPEPTRRIAFFLHDASRLAHVAVLLETLAAVHRLGARDYAFTVFVFGRRDEALAGDFAASGVATVHLEHDGPTYVDRLRGLQSRLREGNFAACFWISAIPMMAVAFACRIAPIQGWWAMKYHACPIDQIDAHLAMENVVTTKSMDGIEWRTFGTASTDWLGAERAEEVRAIRARFPAGSVLAASIGREEKLADPEFLGAVVALLRRHPQLRFLWTGRTQAPAIQARFAEGGVAERTAFIGWVETRLYARAIDLFLDSFPFPCGFTLKEAMAAGKAAVMYRSPESLETGVPGAITPLIEDTASAGADAREDVRRIFTRSADYDLYHCASSPGDYVERASALVGDAGLRERSGAANREFIARFLSSPDDEARKFLDHLDHWTGALPATP
jgi:glycosyltransferase involved in cell wall biosynthesis